MGKGLKLNSSFAQLCRGEKAMHHFIVSLKPNYYWLSSKLLTDEVDDASNISRVGSDPQPECNNLSASSLYDRSSKP